MEDRNIDDQDELINPNRPRLRYIDKRLRPDCFSLSKRYTLALLIHIGFFIIFAIRSNICFFNEAVITKVFPNITEDEVFHKMMLVQFDMDGCFLLAYLLVQIPAGIISYKYPAQRVFGICILASSIIAIITSFTMNWVTFEFGTAAFLQGLVQSATICAVHGMLFQWTPPSERATMATLAYSGTFSGVVFGVLFSGLTCNFFEEEHLLALYGLAGICWYLLWIWLVFERPEYHPTIADHEFEYLQHHVQVPAQKPPIPWKCIFKSMPCWAIFVVYLCRSFNSNYLFQADYTQYNYVRNTESKTPIELSALMLFLFVPSSGYLADVLSNRSSLSTTTIRKMYICGGLLFEAIAYMPGIFLPETSLFYFLDTTIIDLIFYSFTISGYFVNYLDIAPMYACIIMSIANLFGTIIGGFFMSAPGRKPHGDRTFFVIMAVFHVIGVAFYGIWGSGETQPWAKSTENQNEQNSTNNQNNRSTNNGQV